MSPGEMVLLMAIAAAGGHGTKPAGRPADIIGEYADYPCNSPVRRNYLNENESKGYRLTSKGQQALLEFPGANKTNIQDAIETVQVPGIEVGKEIDIPGKKAIEIRR